MSRLDCGFVGGGGSPILDSRLLTHFGPTTLVDIGFDEKYDPTTGRAPALAKSHVPALIDTGADDSTIDAELAKELDLPLVDEIGIATPSGSTMVNSYLAQIHLPSLQHTIYGSLAGVHLAQGGQQHRCLLGRTFLRHITMIYDGPTGAVTILR